MHQLIDFIVPVEHKAVLKISAEKANEPYEMPVIN